MKLFDSHGSGRGLSGRGLSLRMLAGIAINVCGAMVLISGALN